MVPKSPSDSNIPASDNLAAKRAESMEKNAYSHGEPMEIANEVSKSETSVVDEPMETSVSSEISDGVESKCNNVSDLSNVSVSSKCSNSEDGEESTSKMERYRNRRRRKAAVSELQQR